MLSPITSWKKSTWAAPLNWLESCPVIFLHVTWAYIKHLESHRFCSHGKRGCKAPLQYQVHMFFRNIKQITSWKTYQAVIPTGIAKRTQLVTMYSVVLKIKTCQTGHTVHCKKILVQFPIYDHKSEPWSIFFRFLRGRRNLIEFINCKILYSSRDHQLHNYRIKNNILGCSCSGKRSHEWQQDIRSIEVNIAIVDANQDRCYTGKMNRTVSH